MEGVFDWIQAHWGFCAFLLGCFVQFVPGIKVDLFGMFGRLLFKSVDERLDKLEAKVDAVERSRKEDEKDRIRYEVLDFANSCRNKRKHTKDEFQHIFDLNDKYEDLLNQTNDKNGVFTSEFEYIVRLYKRCQEQNDFLA